MTKEMSFVATGDSFITRRLPSEDMPEFQEIKNIINQAEFRFTNFEVVTPGDEGVPSSVSGGTWASAPHDVIKDIKAYGFNCVAWANNHTLDYLYGGLYATERALNEHGLIHAGVGKNLAEASRPKYMECPTARVALIAFTSTFHETWMAGSQRGDCKGRPGVNGLRYKTTFHIHPEKLAMLREIAESTGINAEQELARKEGFESSNKQGSFLFGVYSFQESTEEGMRRTPNPVDKARIKKAICEAKRQADYVIVSVHSHEMTCSDKQRPADFIEEMCRMCIDEGAHAVCGHGPHILRGIEIYQHRPIFYSLGDFIFQNDTIEVLPADFYEKYSLPLDANVADALDKRSKNNTIGLGATPLVWESVIPFWKMEDGKLTELTLYPIELGYGKKRYQRGWPRLSADKSILENVQKLSEPYGTKIDIHEYVGKVILT